MLSSNIILQNRYRIVRKLGEGGMGAIYEAIDQRVSCVVALKETLVETNEARQAFQREAALLANLRHSSLPKVMDYFSEADGEFLVMEYIAGHDLAELLELRSGPFPLDQVLEWAEHILRLLEYLHSRQPAILHRDIKPSNLKVTAEGEIFLLDFGLAKGAAGQMTTTGRDKSVFGYTPFYAPLEQIHGSGTDPRSDIYSLGATLYDLLTGQPPAPASARFEALETDKPDPLSPINELNEAIPAAVAAIIQRAMALHRRDRFADAREMRNALRIINQPELDLAEHARRAEAALAETLPASLPGEDIPLYVDKNVQFTVYSPRRIKPKKIYSLLAFAHLSKKRADAAEDEPDPVEQMRQQAARILGEQRDDYDDTQQPSAQAVPQGGELRFVPVVQGLTFSPPARIFTWRKTVHREEFDMWASEELDGHSLKGRMTVFLGAVVIAEVPLEITVDSKALPAKEKISLEEAQTVRRLRQVFASYSSKDERVVSELAQMAPLFGSQFITDRTHLMPGEDRSEGVRRLISSADAFQLFWSSNSMRSPDVITEIGYAISLNKKNFILPTYWEDPLPRSPRENLPPAELERLHFFRIYPGSFSPPTNQPARNRSTQPAVDSSTVIASLATSASPDVKPTGELAPNLNDRFDTLPLKAKISAAPIEQIPPRASYQEADFSLKIEAPRTTQNYERSAPTASERSAPEAPAMLPQPTTATFGAGPQVILVCTGCLQRFTEDLKFCTQCGSSLRPIGAGGYGNVGRPPVQSAPLPQNFSPTAVARPKRKVMMPILAGIAMVLFVAIVGPVWYFMNLTQANSSNHGSAPLTTSSSDSNQNQGAYSNTNASANVAATPVANTSGVMPSRINPPADFIDFVKNEPAYQEPAQTQEVDLDGDGVPELLAQYEFCGSGGCSIHLFQRSGNGFNDISGDILEYMFPSLNDEARGSFSAGPKSTNGYLDLKYRFKNGRPAMNFKFNGRHYQSGP